jgi:hypothetical protein
MAGTWKNETDLGPSFLRSPFPVGPKSGVMAGTWKNETELGPSFLRSPFPVGPKSGTYFQCLLVGSGVLAGVVLVAVLVSLLGEFGCVC